MKKGFTMIELIFVIVILGILASVAVPRLAATREDAEVSAAVANLRTLVSDASSYYVAHGHFKDAKWRDLTNVPLRKGNRDLLDGNVKVLGGADQAAVCLSAGGTNCILVRIFDRGGDKPARIEIGAVKTNAEKEYICKEIIKAEPIKAYLDAKLDKVTPKSPGAGVIALGSSSRVYNTPTPTPEEKKK